MPKIIHHAKGMTANKLPARIALPGFVDLQVNGFAGVDFAANDLNEEVVHRAFSGLLAAGNAAIVPTIITSPDEIYQTNLPLLASVAARPEFVGRVLGLHLEGPFLSTVPGAAGAHDVRYLKLPDRLWLGRMQDLARGAIVLLTLAAELPQAAEVARLASELGITVCLGHQMAGANDLRRLVDAGAKALTHFGNGVPNLLPRHDNPLWAGLVEDGLSAMVIADGHHVPATFLSAVLRVKGMRGVIVTSDAAPLCGMPPGRYHTLGNDCILEPSGRLYNPDKQCLVGSSATLLDCLNHLASLGLADEHALCHDLGRDNALRLLGRSPSSLVDGCRVFYDPLVRRFTTTDHASRE